MRSSSFVLAVCSLLASSFFLPSQSHADTFTTSYLAAGVQTPGSVTSNVNTFETAAYNSNFNSTTFNGSGITGTYSGNFSVVPANLYGGAGGNGNYITTGSSYTLTLSSPVNYFGLWFSALDAGNQLSFYNGNSLLYTFTASTYQSMVGACPSTTNAYCGNPNAAFKGQDAGEQFAYFNFSDTNGTFNKIVFNESPASSGFESDNHAVALISTVTPEPPSFVLALTGVGMILLTSAVRRSLV